MLAHKTCFDGMKEKKRCKSRGSIRSQKENPAKVEGTSVRDKIQKKPKALILLSGGLDSILATKIILNQDVEVEIVHFDSIFSVHNEQSIDRFCMNECIKLHRISLGQEFLDIVTSPKHGYGSKMNPCIDCRILVFRKAKNLADTIGADFIVTGEVLGERPFSQRRDAIQLIEKAAGLDGRVLRPLCAKLLQESIPERTGAVDRKKLFSIQGRRRLQQIGLARRLNIAEYPNPSGGCLLTDPRFADRVREHLRHHGTLKIVDARLLRIGRHFRVDKTKIIVGRNKEENKELLSLSQDYGLITLEVIGYVGPVTVQIGEDYLEKLIVAAALTARYSDAPKDSSVKVKIHNKGKERILETEAIKDIELRRLII